MNNFLDEQFKKFPRGQTQPWEVGTKPENLKKNRYNILYAYDSSRVKLDLLPGDQHSDYINANYVDGFERPKAYIASQGPMASTVDDFWRMVWQEKVSLIVMLTNLTEDIKVKCEKYWPDADQEGKFGRLTVRNMREEINADYVSRDLIVLREKTKKIVQQLHYTNWPNNGEPLYPQSIAIFVEKISHCQRNECAPILVHCSAGIGRTGTVILIDACLKMFRSRGQLDVISIFTQMRKQRVNLVNTLEQFKFVHLVLLESILNPKFEIHCDNFSEEYKQLTSNSNKKIKKNLDLLTNICNKDFQRADKPAEIEADKCRNPDFISTSSAIVSLFPYGNVTTMNFINAVFVDGYKRAKQFIVTQVPMKNTVWDFWRMIDQFNVKQIIVLNDSHYSYGDFLPTKKRKLDFDEIQVVLDSTDEEKHVKSHEITLNAVKYLFRFTIWLK
ncbi:receptor-type tyrosine-protein phosphatase gamma-like [Cloeon dipterum]|uniref:receptor-type tyrosine-protein phosphatase gamma-like n=1 Tax=Cloeon dipterum TaxID=197152 RepID=UPI00321FEA50